MMDSTTLNDFLSTKFDYVIVGGGTAGLVVAARLAEDRSCQVGVLEAGKSKLTDPNVLLPGNLPKMLYNPEYDWSYHTTLQSGTNGSIHHVARGKMLGGSSGINYMAYVRPAAEDIDHWSEVGNYGWSWKELWPYYLKSQCMESWNHATDLYSTVSQSHGQTGPIKTSFPKRNMPNEDAIIAAFDSVCPTPRQPDPWSGKPLGRYGHLSTINHLEGGIRSYAASAFVKHERSNLKILTEATATKIVLQQGMRVAQAVLFSHGGKIHEIRAGKDIILSSGTIGSPRLLELSGIGHRDVLQAAGVECLVPCEMVGSRLQEHPMTSITYALASEKTAEEHQEPGGVSLMALVPYSTIVSPEEMCRMISVIESASHLSEPERQTIIARLRNREYGTVQYNGTPAFVDIGNGYANQGELIASVPGYETCYTFHVTITNPLSRGSTHITSDDPFATPAIDIGLLNDPVDQELLAAGLEFADRVFSSDPELSARVIKRIVPSPSIDLKDRQQGCSFVRSWTTTFNHMLGTCAMGHVVDEKLRVKGVQGLRVVDASVMPTQISGNIIASVYAVAEKAADLIKLDQASLAL